MTMRVHQVEDDDEGHHHQHEAGHKGGDALGVHDSHGAADELGAAVGQLQVVVEEAEVEAVFIHPQVDVGDQALDDLAEGQGDDGQVVAVEPQHRDADEEAQHGGHQGAEDHGQGQPQRGGGHAVLEGLGKGGAGEGPQAHEAGVAQAQLAGDAHHQVQGQGHGDIGADGDELALQHGAHAPLGKEPEGLDHQEGHDHQGVGEEAGAGRAFHLSESFHGASLTLSPGRPCPAGRRV